MKDSTTKILEKARSIIEDKKNWTKGAMALDAAGRDVLSSSPQACRWCASGAIVRATETLHLDTEDRYDAINHLRDVIRTRIRERGEIEPERISVPIFNDAVETTHQDVLDVLDTAIKQRRDHEGSKRGSLQSA